MKRRSLDYKENSQASAKQQDLLVEKSVLCAKKKIQRKLGTANEKLLLKCRLNINIFAFSDPTQTIVFGHGI